MARKSPEVRRKERQRRRAAVQPKPTVGKGSVVEVTGAAKVDHVDPDFGHVKSDHRGAVGRVEDTHFSEERGEMMAAVKLEDEQTRYIPESRLTDVQQDAMPALASDAKRAERERREAEAAHEGRGPNGGSRGVRLTMPRNSSLPSYTVASMDPAFCGNRCNPSRGKHCLDDHASKGDPDA